jgi:hypothetical protein
MAIRRIGLLGLAGDALAVEAGEGEVGVAGSALALMVSLTPVLDVAAVSMMNAGLRDNEACHHRPDIIIRWARLCRMY